MSDSAPSPFPTDPAPENAAPTNPAPENSGRSGNGAAEAPKPSRFPSRIVSKVVVSIFVFAALTASLMYVMGLNDDAAFRYLGYAAVLALGSCAAWEIVERCGSDEHPGLLAWIAFPIAWLLGLGQMPLLALAIYPPLSEFLEGDGRIEASYVQRPEPRGRRLEIYFPKPVDTERKDSNLRFESMALPKGYLASHEEEFWWVNDQTLSIDIDDVRASLGLKDVETVTLNAELDLGYFHYTDGDAVPHQRVTVRPD